MALDLLEVFESRAIRIPCEMTLRDSLRKPERITTGGGVRIAATRDGAGHADEFWSMALMVRALKRRRHGVIRLRSRRGSAQREIWRPVVMSASLLTW